MRTMKLRFSGSRNIPVSVLLAVVFGSCQHPRATLFTSLSPSQTHVDFANTLPDRPGLGILSYIYYYNGAGVAIGDINNDGLHDL